jgi:cobalt-zinc-cadmium efflux system outer membrane protein
MYRPFIPLIVVALSLPAHAQTSASTLSPLPSTVGAAPTSPTRLREPAAPLSLNRALELAFQANPQIHGARHEFEAVEATVLQANVRPNPTLELIVEDTRRDTRETTLQVSQPLEFGGKRARRVQAAERGRDASAEDLRAAMAKVRSGVTIAFNDVLTAQEKVKLAQESLEVAERVSTTVAKRVQAGKISPVEETRARVSQASVRLELARARSELASARKSLSAFWGNLTPQFELVVGDLEVLPELHDWAELSARLDSTPALSRARIEVERRRALVGVEQSRRTPDVAFTVGMKRSEELGRSQAVFGVAVPLPLFDRNRGNVLESLRREDKARDDLVATETSTHNELAEAYERLRTARQEAQSLATEILPGARSAYEAAVKGFDFGKFAYFDVLDAQRTLIQARTQYLSVLSAARRAAADIDGLLGDTSPANNK